MDDEEDDYRTDDDGGSSDTRKQSQRDDECRRTRGWVDCFRIEHSGPREHQRADCTRGESKRGVSQWRCGSQNGDARSEQEVGEQASDRSYHVPTDDSPGGGGFAVENHRQQERRGTEARKEKRPAREPRDSSQWKEKHPGIDAGKEYLATHEFRYSASMESVAEPIPH